MSRRVIITICFGIPLLLLVAAYVHMSFKYEKVWLFNTIVHENGKYTLLQVMLYFRHFLWEVPIKVVYGFFLVGLFFYYGNPMSTDSIRPSKKIPNFLIISCLTISVLMIVSAFIFAANKFGFQEALNGLLQYRRSEKSSLLFGSHWRNHFLSNIVLFCASGASVIIIRLILKNELWMTRRKSNTFYISSMLFILITLFFGINMDPFTSPSYLGHQLREVFGSDVTITMLLSLGILLSMENKYDCDSGSENKITLFISKRSIYKFITWAVPAVVITLFLIIQVLSLNMSNEMMKLGGAEEWTKLDLFAWHFFEHSLDYILVLFLVPCIYLFILKRNLNKLK